MNMPYSGPDLSYAQGAWSPQGWEHFGIVNGSRANVGWAVGSYYHWQVDRLRQARLEVGHYFFIGNVDAIAAADFFVDNLYDFRVRDTLWLDMEPEGGTGTAVWLPSKCLAFCLRVFQRTGVMPGIYLNKSLENGYDWSALVAAGVRLWSAYYQGGALPSVRNWPEVSMLQYTSTPIDTNAAAYTQAQMAGGGPAPAADQGDSDMIFIYSQNRVGAVFGTFPGRFQVVPDAETRATLLKYLPGSKLVEDREYDVLKQFATTVPDDAVPDLGALTAQLVPALTEALQGHTGGTLDAAQITAAVQAALAGVKIQIDSADLSKTILDAASERHFFTK